jgi:nitrogen fixation protein FixH
VAADKPGIAVHRAHQGSTTDREALMPCWELEEVGGRVVSDTGVATVAQNTVVVECRREDLAALHRGNKQTVNIHAAVAAAGIAGEQLELDLLPGMGAAGLRHCAQQENHRQMSLVPADVHTWTAEDAAQPDKSLVPAAAAAGTASQMKGYGFEGQAIGRLGGMAQVCGPLGSKRHPVGEAGSLLSVSVEYASMVITTNLGDVDQSTAAGHPEEGHQGIQNSQ